MRNNYGNYPFPSLKIVITLIMQRTYFYCVDLDMSEMHWRIFKYHKQNISWMYSVTYALIQSLTHLIILPENLQNGCNKTRATKRFGVSDLQPPAMYNDMLSVCNCRGMPCYCLTDNLIPVRHSNTKMGLWNCYCVTVRLVQRSTLDKDSPFDCSREH